MKQAYGQGTLISYEPIDDKHRIETYHIGDLNFLHYPAYYTGKHWLLYNNGDTSFSEKFLARRWFNKRLRLG